MKAVSRGADTDAWYVTNGVVVVGPVAFDLLTRGLVSGRIPETSFVRHEAWKVWRRLQDIKELSSSSRQRTVSHLATVTADADARASSPFHDRPATATGESGAHRLDSIPPSDDRPSTIRPIAVDPVGVLAHAGDLEEALLLVLSTSATAAAADVGALNRARDSDIFFTTYGHGPGAELLLGSPIFSDDPALSAAHGRCTVMGEPELGSAGRAIASRMHACVGPVRGVAMVPVHVRSRLIATIEVARIARPFRAREIARIEDVVEALVGRITVEGWLD